MFDCLISCLIRCLVEWLTFFATAWSLTAVGEVSVGVECIPVAVVWAGFVAAVVVPVVVLVVALVAV